MSEQIEIGSRWRHKHDPKVPRIILGFVEALDGVEYVLYGHTDRPNFVSASSVSSFREAFEPILQPIRRGQVWLASGSTTEDRVECTTVHVSGGWVFVTGLKYVDWHAYQADVFRDQYSYVRDVEIQEEEL